MDTFRQARLRVSHHDITRPIVETKAIRKPPLVWQPCTPPRLKMLPMQCAGKALAVSCHVVWIHNCICEAQRPRPNILEATKLTIMERSTCLLLAVVPTSKCLTEEIPTPWLALLRMALTARLRHRPDLYAGGMTVDNPMTMQRTISILSRPSAPPPESIQEVLVDSQILAQILVDRAMTKETITPFTRMMQECRGLQNCSIIQTYLRIGPCHLPLLRLRQIHPGRANQPLIMRLFPPNLADTYNRHQAYGFRAPSRYFTTAIRHRSINRQEPRQTQKNRGGNRAIGFQATPPSTRIRLLAQSTWTFRVYPLSDSILRNWEPLNSSVVKSPGH